jgi:hypothetical protein
MFAERVFQRPQGGPKHPVQMYRSMLGEQLGMAAQLI